MGWKTSSYFPPLEDDKAKGESKTLVGATEGESRASIPSSLSFPTPHFSRAPHFFVFFSRSFGNKRRGRRGRGLFPSIFAFFLSLRLCREWGGRGGGRLKLAERKRTKSSPFRFSHNGKWKEREWVGKRTFLTQNNVAKCQTENKTEQFLKVAPSPLN